MIAADLPGAVWRKSSRSGSNANCVEFAKLAECTALRDSKDPAGPHLVFGHQPWAAFIAGIHAGRFHDR